MLLTSPEPDPRAVIALAVGTVTWQSTAMVVGLLTAWSAMGLLAEWQARRTLVAFVRTAPAGLITIHQNSSRGMPSGWSGEPTRASTDGSQGHDVEPSKPRPKLTKRQREEVEELYRQEAEDLYKYACWISRDRASESRDLVQTTFHEAVRAWQEVGRYGPDERRRWLRRVLSNKAIDLWRKQNVIDLTADVPEPNSRSDDPGERAELAIALASCWREIEQMPPIRRRVAHLVWGESWTSKRVAEELGVAPSTVRGHLREARKRLRAAVGHLVPFIDDEEEQEPAP